MKKPLLTLLTAVLLSNVSAQVPNPSFENWTSGTPDGWVTTFIGSSQSTQAHTGTYALKMNPWSATEYGSITNCPQGSQKIPLNGLTPTSLTGWYIGNFVNGDQLSINATIYDATGAASGSAYQVINTISSSYAPFNIPVTLYGTADSARIQIMQITAAYGSSGLNSATYVILDDINFAGTVGIEKYNQQNNYNVHFNSAANELEIFSANTATKNISIVVTDVFGKEILKSSLVQLNSKQAAGIALHNISTGMYLVHIKDEAGVISLKKISISN